MPWTFPEGPLTVGWLIEQLAGNVPGDALVTMFEASTGELKITIDRDARAAVTPS